MGRVHRPRWVVLLGACAACSLGTYSGEVQEPPIQTPTGGTVVDDAGSVVQPTDLPCDVAAVLSADCLLCHGPVPTNSAPNRLDGLAQLRAPSKSEPTKSNGQLALERMQSPTSPMPPAPYARATAPQISIFSTWVTGGMQAGSCVPPTDAGVPPVQDGGVGGGGPSDAGVSGDLPCDVAHLLGGYCTSCHGDPPTNSAPVILNSLGALRAVSPAYPGQSEGQRASFRMSPASSTEPMPPSPYAAVPTVERDTFANWIAAGMPAGTCAPPTDAGVPPLGDGGVDAGPVDAGVAGDLPCGVAQTLATYCTACHGSPTANGAPFPLNSRAALQAMSPTYPGQTLAQRSVVRMQSTTQPMPPSPYAPVPTANISEFSAWVSSGTPAGSCTAPTDGGTPPVVDGGVDAGPVDAGVSGDLPCTVAHTLGTYCTACHGSPPTNGAPFPLNSRAALLATSPTYPGQNEGQRSLVRMQSTTQQMPPPPYAAVPAADIADFSSWIGGGMPPGSCTTPTDGGVPPVNDGGVDAGTPDAGVAGDLPCDVADVLTTSCTGCHGSPPTGGAPMALTTLPQLRAPSPSNASVTTGQACVQRMASTTSPMPPPPAAPVAAAKQSAFAAWVSAGMQAGTCTVDAGTPDPVFSGPPTCTSNTYWTQGDEGSSQMHPGRACITCHATTRGEAPTFSIAGTAYPTGHEYDDCYGSAAQSAVVSVTDSRNVTRTFTANRAGNFYSEASGSWPVFPIRAQISFGGRTRAMSGAVNSGDCNTCHTLQGLSGAPGRIALP